MAAARFPAKTPARTAATNAHPHLPVSIASSGRGRGGVSSRLADMDATRPKEGGARWLKEKAEWSTCEEAHESVGVLEKTSWRIGRVAEKRTLLRGARC